MLLTGICWCKLRKLKGAVLYYCTGLTDCGASLARRIGCRPKGYSDTWCRNKLDMVEQQQPWP